ncbi:hypothetical protein F5884DRAFT_821294 [Xylogone sp. PMI_703]|nr:hypothetical protein F5884DRAFT_821294 [Xylogone sp. PMI_703]
MPGFSTFNRIIYLINVVEADLDDEISVKKATAGAHTVFAVTVSIYDERLKEREFNQAKAMVEGAIKTGASYFIFSTLPNAKELSSGKFPDFLEVDSKYAVEQYIRGLPIKIAFFAPGFFMQNFHTFSEPRPLGDGTYDIFNFVKPETELPLIGVPEKFQNKVLSAATTICTYQEVAEIMTKVSGKSVNYVQIPKSTFLDALLGEPIAVKNIVGVFTYYQDIGYYGPHTKELVAATAQQARGKLNTFENYIIKNPLKFD